MLGSGLDCAQSPSRSETSTFDDNISCSTLQKGLPWSASKGFDTFCPVSDFIPRESLNNPHDVELWLSVDGVEKQRGNTKDMVFKIPQLIAHVSSIMTLEEGDLICTGTVLLENACLIES